MTILFFARARDLAGAAELTLDLPAGSTLADVRRRLTERIPALSSLLPHCALAVNDAYADDDDVPQADDRIAVLPPVSGG